MIGMPPQPCICGKSSLTVNVSGDIGKPATYIVHCLTCGRKHPLEVWNVPNPPKPVEQVTATEIVDRAERMRLRQHENLEAEYANIVREIEAPDPLGIEPAIKFTLPPEPTPLPGAKRIEPPDDAPIVGMCLCNGTVYLATSQGVYRLNGDVFEPMMFVSGDDGMLVERP